MLKPWERKLSHQKPTKMFEVPLRGMSSVTVYMVERALEDHERDFYQPHETHEHGVFVHVPGSENRKVIISTDRKAAYEGFAEACANQYIQYITYATWDLDPRVPADHPLRQHLDMITTVPVHEGPACAFPGGCGEIATLVGLLQVANPSPETGERGIQRNVPVCEYHGMVWSGLWGTWDLENDSEYGVVFGAEGKPVYEMERQRQWGELREEEFAAWWEGYTSAPSTGGVSLAKRQVVTRPTFTPGDQVSVDPDAPGFVESDYQPAPIMEQVRVADLEPNWDIRLASGIVATVDQVDPLPDKRGRIGVYLIEHAGGEVRKVRLRPGRMVTRLH